VRSPLPLTQAESFDVPLSPDALQYSWLAPGVRCRVVLTRNISHSQTAFNSTLAHLINRIRYKEEFLSSSSFLLLSDNGFSVVLTPVLWPDRWQTSSAAWHRRVYQMLLARSSTTPTRPACVSVELPPSASKPGECNRPARPAVERGVWLPCFLLSWGFLAPSPARCAAC
jgi:hypothetical protein